MGTRPALGDEEFDAQTLDLLPPRETLLFDFTIAPVVGVNVALAINAASINTSAAALAGQTLLSLHY